MGSHPVEGDLPFLQQTHEILARHTKIVCRCLSGECLILRHHYDCFLLGHQAHDPREMGEKHLWDVSAVSLRVDQRHVIRHGEDFGQLGQSFLRNEGRIQSVGACGKHEIRILEDA